MACKTDQVAYPCIDHMDPLSQEKDHGESLALVPRHGTSNQCLVYKVRKDYRENCSVTHHAFYPIWSVYRMFVGIQITGTPRALPVLGERGVSPFPLSEEKASGPITIQKKASGQKESEVGR